MLVKFQKRYPGQPVEVVIPDEFVSIPMDTMLIEQVLINLLENAVQHAEGDEQSAAVRNRFRGPRRI